MQDRRRLNEISYFLLGKRITFFLNAFSRNLDPSKVFKKLLKNLPMYSFNIVLSNSTDLATAISQEISSEHGLLIVMGGDGTINTAIQRLLYSPITLAVIPSGTANDFASTFGIPEDQGKALAIIRQGHTRKVDVIRVNNSHFLTVGGVGFPTFVAEAVNRFKERSGFLKFLHRHILRGATYTIFTFLLILRTGIRHLATPVRIEVDGQCFYDGPAVAAFVGKQECVGKHFLACPDVGPDSEYFGVAVIKFKGFWQAMRDILKVSRGHSSKARMKSATYDYTRGQSFKITTPRQISFLGDGEILDTDICFIGSRKPDALTIIVP